MVISRFQKLVSTVLILTPLLGIPLSMKQRRSRELLHAVCSEEYQNLERARKAANRRAIWEAQDLLSKCESRVLNGIVISERATNSR